MASAHLLRIGLWLHDHLFGAHNALAEAAVYFMITFAAALATQLLFWDIDPETITRRVVRIVPAARRARLATPIIFLGTIALGALIGFAIYAPNDGRQATLAGVGWYTALRSVRTKWNERERSGGH